MRSPRRAARALLTAGLVGAGTSCIPAASSRITVDATVRHQVMTGWEATAQAGQEDPAFDRFRDAVVRVAVDDLGINRLRLEVRAGAERNSDAYGDRRAGRLTERQWRCLRYTVVNDDPDPRTINWAGFQFAELDLWVERVVLPMRERLAARQERLFLNVNYVAFIGQCGRTIDYPHADPEEYAEFVLATVLHLRERYGLVPDAWEVILEPEHNRHWTGRRIGEAIVAAAQRLREHGIAMRFIAPSNTDASGAVRTFDELSNVPGALPLLAEFAYHRYRGVSPRVLEAIGERTRRHGVPSAMLERIGADVDDLLDDLTLAQVSAWQQFTLTYPGDSTGPRTGGHYIAVTRGPGDSLAVTLAPRSRLLRQVFHYVRPEAQRVGAVSDRPTTRPVAFQNRDGSWVVVARTAAAESLEVAGLPPGRYAATWTTDRSEGGPVDLDAGTDGVIRTGIPAAGVLTVYTRRARSVAGL
jgi:GNAT superfamily N-acetyltransferase